MLADDLFVEPTGNSAHRTIAQNPLVVDHRIVVLGKTIESPYCTGLEKKRIGRPGPLAKTQVHLSADAIRYIHANQGEFLPFKILPNPLYFRGLRETVTSDKAKKIDEDYLAAEVVQRHVVAL